jgi:hypothetical protein
VIAVLVLVAVATGWPLGLLAVRILRALRA